MSHRPPLLPAVLAATHLIAAAPASAQAPPAAPLIQVGRNTRVSADSFSRPLVEPHIAVSPRNPDHLVVATIVSKAVDPSGDDRYCALFTTYDGGRSWSAHAFAQALQCADPWVAIGLNGWAYAVVLGTREDQSGRRYGLFVYRSEDSGRTCVRGERAIPVDGTVGEIGVEEPRRGTTVYRARPIG